MNVSRIDPLVLGNVVGDIVDPFYPSASFKVFHNNKEMTSGSELKPSQVSIEPRVQIGGRDMRTLYTLVCILSLSLSLSLSLNSQFLSRY
jgi:protein FLOWERING LOCUS T